MWAKAVTSSQQAGNRGSRRRLEGRGAVASFEQALQAFAHLPAHGDTRGLAIELRLALSHPLHLLGESGRRLALLGEAEALARALDDRARLGRVLAEMAQVLRHGVLGQRERDARTRRGHVPVVALVRDRPLRTTQRRRRSPNVVVSREPGHRIDRLDDEPAVAGLVSRRLEARATTPARVPGARRSPARPGNPEPCSGTTD